MRMRCRFPDGGFRILPPQPTTRDRTTGEQIQLLFASQRALDFLDRGNDTSPRGLTERFISMWRAVLERSNFEAGCAVLTVAVTADEPELKHPRLRHFPKVAR